MSFFFFSVFSVFSVVNSSSFPLATALFGDSAVIALNQIVILGHERMRIRVGVHLSAERLRQMSPYPVFVEIGVFVAAIVLIAASAAVAVLAVSAALHLAAHAVFTGARFAAGFTAAALTLCFRLPLALVF